MISTSSSTLIRLEGVSYKVSGKQVLQGISLRGTEKRIGIVGRNGSGKTTLARLLAGLIAPGEGTVSIDGLDVAADRRGALGAVGILFQNPDHQIIFPTVIEELSFGLAQMGCKRPAVREKSRAMLARFDRLDWADVPIHNLSQGQRHLVCLMSVLAMDPRVIVLDEPFAGLDIPTRMQLERHFRQVSATLVHITHDPQSLQGYDRVIWLDQGRVVKDGAPGPVLAAFSARMQQIGGADDLVDIAG